MPDLDSELLLAHLEYSAWAINKTIEMVDKIPVEAITQQVESSLPSILATLQHLYSWNKYYFTHFQGGSIGVGEVIPPETYDDLKREFPKLDVAILAWAEANLAERKDVVLNGWAAWPTWMIVMQIANHTTHHLGQIVTLARQAGYTPECSDWTDLILFYQQRFPQNNH